MFDAGARDAIYADPPIRGRYTPLGLDESLFEKSLEGRVERALFDLQEVSRGLLNALDERVAVHRLLLEEAKHHHLERAGEQVARFGLGHCGVGDERAHPKLLKA